MSNSLSEPLSFDRVASDYERTRSLPVEVGLSVGGYIADVVKDGWILDAGCGTGRFTRPLSQRYSEVVGVDVSREMLTELRRQRNGLPNPLLLTGDLRSLPFLDGQFAAVLTVHVLHLITEWQDALTEMWRILAPDGLLLIGYEDRSQSAVRDFYMTEGRRRGLLPEHPGARNTEGVIVPFLKDRFTITEHEKVSLPRWQWTYQASVAGMLADLDRRLYSSQWQIPESAHADIMAATRANAKRVFGTIDEDKQETLETRFVLHVLRKGMG